LFYKITL